VLVSAIEESDPDDGGELDPKHPITAPRIALQEQRVLSHQNNSYPTLTLTLAHIFQLKLAKVGKLKSNWELQQILGVVVLVIGFLAGKWCKSASKTRVSLLFS
jgi:hypothetical protein